MGEERPAPDLVDRDFTAEGPDKLWVADITHIPTRTGFLYLAVILDVWSRKVVGWAMDTHMRAELVVQALEHAIELRRPPAGLIHHSDQGCQYTSNAFVAACESHGVRRSMGSVGDCYDNALAESFFATLECELIQRTCWDTPVQAGVRCSRSSMAGTTRTVPTRLSACPEDYRLAPAEATVLAEPPHPSVHTAILRGASAANM